MESQKLIFRKHKPLIVSGCSGVGKGTLITNIVQCFPELFQLSVSYTTRPPRPGETYGLHYFFISKQDFQKLVLEGDFMEYCQVHGNLYGTSISQVNTAIANGKICLLDIDQQGAEKIYHLYPNWNYLFIVPPSLEELEGRIRGRGTENEQAIRRRMGNAAKQLERLKQLPFYEILLNDKISVSYPAFITYINLKYGLLIQMQK